MESAQAGINIILKHPKRIIRIVQRKDRTMAMQSQINANVDMKGIPEQITTMSSDEHMLTTRDRLQMIFRNLFFFKVMDIFLKHFPLLSFQGFPNST